MAKFVERNKSLALLLLRDTVAVSARTYFFHANLNEGDTIRELVEWTSEEGSELRNSSAVLAAYRCTSIVFMPAPRVIMEARQTPVNNDVAKGDDAGTPLLDLASAELERMRNSKDGSERCFHSFPPACLTMLKNLEGNHRCVDCGEQNPQWAACRYGALLCLQCSGQHRSLGVQVSCVRSICMDEWSVTEVVSMLEGGNSQLATFFDRHELTEKACNATGKTMITKENVARLRYKTKAALFYRRQMEVHVDVILAAGPYRGREVSRQLDRALPEE